MFIISCLHFYILVVELWLYIVPSCLTLFSEFEIYFGPVFLPHCNWTCAMHVLTLAHVLTLILSTFDLCILVLGWFSIINSGIFIIFVRHWQGSSVRGRLRWDTLHPSVPHIRSGKRGWLSQVYSSLLIFCWLSTWISLLLNQSAFHLI